MPTLEALTDGRVEQVAFNEDGDVEVWVFWYALHIASSLVIQNGDVRIAKGEPGWRDALCALLGQRVTAATLREDTLTIALANGRLEIPVGVIPSGQAYAARLSDPDGPQLTLTWPPIDLAAT